MGYDQCPSIQHTSNMVQYVHYPVEYVHYPVASSMCQPRVGYGEALTYIPQALDNKSVGMESKSSNNLHHHLVSDLLPEPTFFSRSNVPDIRPPTKKRKLQEENQYYDVPSPISVTYTQSPTQNNDLDIRSLLSPMMNNGCLLSPLRLSTMSSASSVVSLSSISSIDLSSSSRSISATKTKSRYCPKRHKNISFDLSPALLDAYDKEIIDTIS